MQTEDPTLFRWRGIIDDQGRIRPVGKEDDHHQPARHNNSPFSVREPSCPFPFGGNRGPEQVQREGQISS